MTDHPDPRELAAATGARRRELLEHAAGCARCRAGLVGQDPSALFALLGLAEPPGARLEELSRRVSTAIDAGPRPRAGRRRAALGSVAAAVILAGVLGTYVWRWRPPAAPAATTAPLEVAAAAPEPAEPAAAVEVLSSPGTVQVVDLTVGDTHVTMIFDRSLDL